jgi:hypothetical protein
MKRAHIVLSLAIVVGGLAVFGYLQQRQIAVCMSVPVEETLRQQLGPDFEFEPTTMITCRIGDFTVHVTPADTEPSGRVLIAMAEGEYVVSAWGHQRSIWDEDLWLVTVRDADQDGTFDYLTYESRAGRALSVSDANLDGQPDMRIERGTGADGMELWVEDAWYRVYREGGVLVDGVVRKTETRDGSHYFADVE